MVDVFEILHDTSAKSLIKVSFPKIIDNSLLTIKREMDGKILKGEYNMVRF